MANYSVAIAFPLCLYSMLNNRTPARQDTYAAAATLLSGCSYTLYLTHLPILVLMRRS